MTLIKLEYVKLSFVKVAIKQNIRCFGSKEKQRLDVQFVKAFVYALNVIENETY